MHGAIVSFDKNSIRPTSSTTTLSNSPADAYLHFTIKVDIILFAPRAGIYLSGECTEVMILIIVRQYYEQSKNFRFRLREVF